MPTLLQQMQMSFDAENTTAESLELAEQQRDPLKLQQQIKQETMRETIRETRERPLQLQTQLDPLQLQIQQRAEREHLQHREKMQMHQREHIAQLQSINNLLLDLPPTPKGSYQSARGHESPYSQSLKGSEGDMSISDLFGLGLPRGSLMGSQSSIGSSSYRQQYNGQSNGHSPPRLSHPQHDESHGHYPNSWTMDMPGTPNSATTPGSPSTPGSVYSNPYSYSTGGNSSGYMTPSPSNRSHYNLNSQSSPGHSPYYGRPIRGSPAYSDCSSPTLDYPHMLGFGGSRSNSPADSETSGYSSVDGSLSDIMVRNYLSLNPSGHSYYPPPLGGLMSPELDLYHGGNRGTAYQRMAAKKYQQQQHQNMRHHHCCSPANHLMPMKKAPNIADPHISLDRAAKIHRNAAALCEATCTWSGELPKRTLKSSGYSSKVFLGGVPWDATESLLMSTFKQFSPIRVEWPGKSMDELDDQPKGFAYIILESEKHVKSLLSCCTHRFGEEKSWYYRIVPKRSKPKDVQVIPWHISESNYSKSSSQKLDPEKTVFVGALHGMLTAEGLAKVMNDLFEEVIYTGIDTDKWKYPIGSARVTFASKRSYKKACAAAFVEIRAGKFTKKVQIDPYIEDSVCSSCVVQHGPYFCREPICSRYFCRSCWHWQHASEPMRDHQPMSRGSKGHQVVSVGPNWGTNGNRSCRSIMM